MNDLVSVVVPVYNVEPYLDRCINSIVNQTYKNLEIILVDDGSPDKCPEICDEWAKNDERIKVIHQKNSGLSGARNKGIESSIGKYICFVDSDDYVNENFVSCLYSSITENKSDISICGYKEKYPNSETDFSYENGEGIISKEDLFRSILSNEQMGNFFANKMFIRELFDSIRFPVGKFYEDIYTFYKVAYLAEKIYVINNILYTYIRRQNSTTNIINKKALYDENEAISMRNSFIKEHYKILSKECEANELKFLIVNYNQFSKKCGFLSEKKELREKILKYNIKNTCLQKKYTIMFYLIKYLPQIYSVFVLLLVKTLIYRNCQN